MHAVTIKISMTEYHHWINSLVHRLLHHYSLWGKWVWYFWSLAYILTCLKHLIMHLRCNLFRASYLHPITDTCRAMQLRCFLKWKHNNVFNALASHINNKLLLLGIISTDRKKNVTYMRERAPQKHIFSGLKIHLHIHVHAVPFYYLWHGAVYSIITKY